MKRLTFDGCFCDIAQCRELPCPYDGMCSQRKVWERLKEYEDAGLSPEMVAHLKIVSMGRTIAQITEFEGVPIDRLRELAEADRAGRLVVLPCKVGQRVFALMDTDKHISECEVKQIGMGNEIGFIGLEPIGTREQKYGVALSGFGKTVFLTREEAEKAMEATKDA